MKKLNGKCWGVIGLCLGLLLGIHPIFAVEKPRGLASDARIKIVAFQRDNVVPIQASTFTSTQIVFGSQEVIKNIQNGDLDAWTVSVQKGLANMLFLKPTIVGSNTNMTVVTNRHTYYFQLLSQANKSDQTTYAIHFIYPDEQRANLNANLRYNAAARHAILNAHHNPKNYHWDYSFSGDQTIMPLHVFDDGHFTYLQLQHLQPIPAIFAVDNPQGKEAVVNYRRVGNYLVVQQVAPQLTLREGQSHVVSIFNNQRIRQLQRRGEG